MRFIIASQPKMNSISCLFMVTWKLRLPQYMQSSLGLCWQDTGRWVKWSILILKKRYNVMEVTSVAGFAHIKGGMNGSCKDVYFLRVVGRQCF